MQLNKKNHFFVQFLYFILILPIIVLFFSTFNLIPTQAAYPDTCANFYDVPISHPNCAAITYLKDSEVIQGYDDGSFGPDNYVNRAEALKMLLLANNAVHLTDNSAILPFSDTPPNLWYIQYVNSALALEIIQGYPDGSFKPNQEVNRVEMLKMALELYGVELANIDTSNIAYTDIDQDQWYTPYVVFSQNYILVDPDPFGQFLPGEPMTRAVVAETIYRIAKLEDPSLININNGPGTTGALTTTTVYDTSTWLPDFTITGENLPVSMIVLSDLTAINGKMYLNAILYETDAPPWGLWEYQPAQGTIEEMDISMEYEGFGRSILSPDETLVGVISTDEKSLKLIDLLMDSVETLITIDASESLNGAGEDDFGGYYNQDFAWVDDDTIRYTVYADGTTIIIDTGEYTLCDLCIN